jgi:carbonic anhydrase
MKRSLLRTLGILTLFGAAVVTAQTPMPSADAVLKQLQAGNANFVAKRNQRPHQSAERLHELASGQSPSAIILSCADSRVPPELVFDQGFGDLFVIRVAGNVPGNDEVASIEYAAEHLHTPLVVVLGHQHCGAVEAAVQGGDAHGHLPELLAMIRPAVAQAKKEPGDAVANAVRHNVENVVNQLRHSSPVIGPIVDKGTLKVVGGVYSLDTGKVQWLTDVKSTARLDTCPIVRSNVTE